MIIYNNRVPFKGFVAMAVYPFIFVRKEYKDNLSEAILRHEKIHFKQQLELFLIGFYVLYFIFWLRYGYRKIPFEREAYQNQHKHIYNRKPYNWIKYL